MAAIKRLSIPHHSADYIFHFLSYHLLTHYGHFENHITLQPVHEGDTASQTRLPYEETDSQIFVLLYVLCFILGIVCGPGLFGTAPITIPRTGWIWM